MFANNLQYRIHQDVLLQINNNNRKTDDYYIFEDNFSKTIQYLSTDTELLNKFVFYHKVTNNGSKVNKSWLSSELLTNQLNLVSKEIKQIEISLLLKQGFNWNKTKGIVFVLKDKISDIIYFSQYITINDFKLSNDTKFIADNYWKESINFYVPDFIHSMDNISFGIETVSFDDMLQNDNYYEILTYPKQYEALILDEPLSDKLNVSLEWNDNLQLKIKPISLIPEYTFEQLFKWNFSIDNIDTLDVKHLIRFKSDTEGNYNEFVISNNINPINEIIVGLPLIYTEEKQVISVTTYFIINGKIATRYNSIVYDYIQNNVNNQNTSVILNPINITENVIIENKIVDTITKTKVIKVPEHKFVEMILNYEIEVDNKNISFEEVEDKPTYMKIIIDEKVDENESPNLMLFSNKTELSKFYFNISKVNSVMNSNSLKECEFKLYDFNTNTLILKGKFFKN